MKISKAIEAIEAVNKTLETVQMNRTAMNFIIEDPKEIKKFIKQQNGSIVEPQNGFDYLMGFLTIGKIEVTFTTK